VGGSGPLPFVYITIHESRSDPEGRNDHLSKVRSEQNIQNEKKIEELELLCLSKLTYQSVVWIHILYVSFGSG
jgi:hypothetical protein